LTNTHVSLIADRAVNQRRGDRAVHAAAQAADDAARPHLLADRLLGFGDQVRRRPVGLAAAHIEREVAQQCLALGRVLHLRMELHAVNSAIRIAHRRDGRRRRCQRRKRRRQVDDVVAVAHPDAQLERKPAEERRVLRHDRHARVAVLAPRRRIDPSAEVVRQ
jgi:hypothetical protein